MKILKKIFMTLALLAVTISMMAACTNKPKAAEATEAVAVETAEATIEAAEAPVAAADDDEMAPNFELPDLQVRCPDNQLQELAEMYGIEGFPTKAVVSPEGKLLKVVVGEDPEFYTFLDELFAE